MKRSMSSSPLSLFTAVHHHRRSCFCLVVHVCATAHLPNVVLVGAFGPALSELVVSTENVQFSGCGSESQGGTYRVGSGCTYVHRVGKVRSTLYDATRAAHAPAINYKSMMQLMWGARAIQTMGASFRQAAATHGYRRPHQMTTREHVHRC